jgi:hypothetical protein
MDQFTRILSREADGKMRAVLAGAAGAAATHA